MQSAIYFPIIRGREGELHALSRLSPDAKSRMAVVIELPTVELPFGRSLEEHIGNFVAKLTKAWGTERALYVDLSRYGPDNVDSQGRHAVEHLFDCARQSRLRAVPVAGPLIEREHDYLQALTRIVTRDGLGSALRLHYRDFSDESTLRREIAATLALLHLEAPQVDLILDVESIDRMPPDLAEPAALLATVKRALLTVRGVPFRTLVFTGSSVPDPLPRHPKEQPLILDRCELEVWRQLATDRTLPLVRFGDTGIWSPHQLDLGGGGGGAPPARVRIPLAEHQLFFKAESTAYRTLAGRAMQHPGVQALPDCWGLDEIRRSAAGSGGIESASGWVARDTNTHLEGTVVTVAAHLMRVGRLQEVSVEPVRRAPWGQTTLIG